MRLVSPPLYDMRVLSADSSYRTELRKEAGIFLILNIKIVNRRSQWPRGLRRGSAAARLLRLWVRNPTGGHGCLYVVSVVCCQVEVSATG